MQACPAMRAANQGSACFIVKHAVDGLIAGVFWVYLNAGQLRKVEPVSTECLSGEFFHSLRQMNAYNIAGIIKLKGIIGNLLYGFRNDYGFLFVIIVLDIVNNLLQNAFVNSRQCLPEIKPKQPAK